MAVTKSYHGTTYTCYNWHTGELRATSVKPAGYGWEEPLEISYEDLDFIENN